MRYIAEVLGAARAHAATRRATTSACPSRTAPISTRDCLPLYITPQVNEEKVVKGGWHKVSGVFDATGTEKFLLIGNFYGDEVTSHERQPDGERGAYYFIDDVNVRIAPAGHRAHAEAEDEHAAAADASGARPREQHRPWTSTRWNPPWAPVCVWTMCSSSSTRPRCCPATRRNWTSWWTCMTDFPFLRVEIEGHTDDQGSDAYNLKLSDDRAKAVVDYLLKKKVDKERLTWKGYGETKPLKPNDRRAQPGHQPARGVPGDRALGAVPPDRIECSYRSLFRENRERFRTARSMALGNSAIQG